MLVDALLAQGSVSEAGSAATRLGDLASLSGQRSIEA